MANDYWGSKIIGNNALHYYYLSDEDIERPEPNKILIPPVDSVISAFYMPYLKSSDVNTIDVDLDLQRFPLQEGIITGLKLKRIESEDILIDDLVSKENPLGVKGVNIGGNFKWQNEGKLWLSPYNIIEFDDSMGTPLQIHPQYLKDKSIAKIRIRQNINSMGMYLLYCGGYKGDSSGLIEGVTNSGLVLATTSSAYTDYMARSQNQFKLNRLSSFVGAGSGVVGGIAQAGTGSVFAGMSTVSSSLMSPLNSFAQEKDLQNTPATIHSNGGEISFNMQESRMLKYNRFTYHDEHLNRIGWFFHQFGYKQNKIMKPDINSRTRFNYIKTIECNISINGIHKTHLETMKDIFNRGVRIWHVDNNVKVGDYTLDNKEV